MREVLHTSSSPRLRFWLIICYTLFIVYASLSPFSGWRDQGLDFVEVLRAPLLLTYSTFDVVVNLLAYIPFGLLVGLISRARFGVLVSIILGSCSGILLSANMEYLQMYLPMRTSSNLDVLTNSAGTLMGALLAGRMTSSTWLFSRLTRWRLHWFRHEHKTDFGLALLALWMFGQANPSLPMLGNVFISEVTHHPFVKLQPTPFDVWESGAVALNLLMLGILMLTLLRVPRNVINALLLVLSVVALAKFVSAALLLKSWALLLWLNGEAMLGILLGVLVLMAIVWLPRVVAIGFGAAIALAYFIIVNFVLDSSTPAAAMSIYIWHYRHLLNYNGLAQTITLVFPLLLLIHLWRIRKV